jgi:hypothetical protein
VGAKAGVLAVLVIAIALALSAASAAPADPWIGNWKSIDVDGSNQTLRISKRADGTYAVVLHDDSATLCDGIAAAGVGVGTVSGNAIAGTVAITCADGRLAGTFPFKGTYDPKTDTFTDGLGVVWSRVTSPPPPKATPLPLGRLVLTAAEAPGLKPRSAGPAAARKALARWLRPARLPAFVASQTQVARFARGSTELWSIAFVMKSTAAARAATRALGRAGHGQRVRLGAGGFVVARPGHPHVVLWWRGRVLAATSLSTDRGREAVRTIALDYSGLQDARIARSLAQTAWTRALDRVGAQGRVSRSAALEMFAVAYGTLPGSRRPSGPAGRVPDGTVAARHVIGIWRTLNAAQRTAAASRLGITGVGPTKKPGRLAARRLVPTTAAAAAAAAILGDPNFVPNAELQKQADFFAKAIGANINRKLGLAIVAGGTTTAVGEANGDAVQMDENGGVSVFGPICRIRLTVSGQKTSIAYRSYIVAHEVMHCFQFDITPGALVELPDWLIEGMAEWAGVKLTQSFEAADWYQKYLFTCRDTPLFERTYDATGFYGHVDDAVGPFWSRVAGVLTAGGNAQSYTAAGGGTEQFLDTWAPSIFLRPDLGLAWYATSPLELAGAYCDRKPVLDNWVENVPPYQLEALRLEPDPPADRPLLHVQAARGHARIADGFAVDNADLQDSWFCVRGECRCPPDTAGFPPPAQLMILPAHVGVTGGPTGEVVRLTFVSLKDYCHEKQKPPPPPCPAHRLTQAAQACPAGGHSPPGPGETFNPKEDPPEPLQCYGHGCARSVADPHLSPFDSPWYDFQGAGEFTLVKSTSDDLEIQVRQQPWPGPQNKTVAQNVAVAMRVAGDRVGVYKGNPLVVRVNRRPVLLGKKDLRLPGGGTIKPLPEGQLDVVWPDSSAVRVVPTGDLSTDVIVSLAVSRQGRVRGLLGNDDPTSSDADDFTTRGGRRLDQELVRGTGRRAYNLLYHVFGESWRITQKSSLFDYARGQSTGTFTDRRFPARILSPEALDARQRRNAEAVCRRMRLTSARVFRNCVLDVASTGFFSFAVSASTAERSARLAKNAPKPIPRKPGATVRWAGKTYTFRPSSSQDGCDVDSKDIRFSVQFTRSPGRKVVFGFKLVVVKGTKDGTYKTGVGAVFEIEYQVPVEIENLTVTLSGLRTRGTFSGNASTPGKEPVSGSFSC